MSESEREREEAAHAVSLHRVYTPSTYYIYVIHGLNALEK